MPIDMLPSWSCVSASHTLNIGPTKLTSLLPESGPRYGNISHIDINHAATDVVTHYHFTTKAFAEGIIQPRQKFSHKGTFGHAAIFAGSKGMMGAAVLSTKACLRSGVGLVTALVPNIGHDILQSSAPEAMCYTLGENILSDDVDIKILDHFKAMGIGCGIGTEAKTCQWIEKLLATTHIPMVIDADALNIIAQLKVKIPQQAIITPHPKEFDRLFGPSSTSLERIEKQRHYAHDLNITIVLKGHHTTIANSSGHLYFNSTGNAGMAKGGSGDVLTGLITGLLAQGYT
ncbi:MAG TPA: NAD(P)H-hydrate dehydratase, partial [Saprospiraceae bacterium]|nr:NAD(P)H-hydrate dehydratase [Saprospiraceae bacterium]